VKRSTKYFAISSYSVQFIRTFTVEQKATFIMPIDFQLSATEDGIRKHAAAFAAGPLKAVKAEYMKYADEKRFQALKPLYGGATAGGMIKGLIASHLGGAAGRLTEATILVEEMYSVDPSASLTIFATGLGLTPLNLAAKSEHKEFLEPFLSGEGAPLASLVFSEPGGVANYLEKGAPGLNTTATLEGDEWVLNGEKVRVTAEHSRNILI
jgi:alkylation response protein AidB-like acyl-CoA dehydrogenase